MRSSTPRTRLCLAEAGLTARSTEPAGPGLLAECQAIGGCPTGEARLTSGRLLPASHVIHTVGPIWRGGEEGERQLLETCYRSCLVIAHTEQFPQIAFAAIATGIYGFPREEAARIAATTVVEHLAERDFPKRVICVCFDPATFQAYQKALGREA